jgi:sulfonate transport system ATP-binding protein
VTLPATLPTSRSTAFRVTLDSVSRSFGERRVLTDVSLDIAPGEIVAFVGPSGGGKSTLLRQVTGLDRPDHGTVNIDGTALRGIDQRSAIAFQEPRLLPWRTIAANIALGLAPGTPRAEGRERVDELIQLVQLGHAAQLRPREVSGGMAQRASLARALARNPGVLVLDEPFGALDALTRLTMQDLLLDIHAVEPATILLVTHDVDEALVLADRVVLLGESSPGAGSGIRSIVSVPGSRPRDRGDARLGDLRAELLDGLGVPSHHPSAPTP